MKSEVVMTVDNGYGIGSNNSARIYIDKVGFSINDPFAVYLATCNNQELASYLQTKAEEIKRFLADIESRIKP